MTTPVLYTLGALIFYSAVTVIYDQKLGGFPANYLNFAFYLIGVCLLGTQIIHHLWTDHTHVIETYKPVTKWVLASVLCVLVADYLYINAFTHHADVYVVTPIIGLVPLVATIIKIAVTDTRPTWQQTTACVLASIAVALVTLSPEKTVVK